MLGAAMAARLPKARIARGPFLPSHRAAHDRRDRLHPLAQGQARAQAIRGARQGREFYTLNSSPPCLRRAGNAPSIAALHNKRRCEMGLFDWTEKSAAVLQQG